MSIPPPPSTYHLSPYRASLPPRFPFTPSSWPALAHSYLPPDSISYLSSNAGTSSTATKNLFSFTKFSLIPSLLTASPDPSLSTTLPRLSLTFPFPIALAPVGVQSIFHPLSESASSAAAAAESIPFILSSATTQPLEQVALANTPSGARWFQLYWPGPSSWELTCSLLARAKKAGYSVLVVTLDTLTVGWRPGDIDRGYNPFMRADDVGWGNGRTDEVFRRVFKERGGKEVEEDVGAAKEMWGKMVFGEGGNGWKDLERLRREWGGKVVLKGVQSVRDARKAVESGVEGIVVSNHGGRQMDGGAGALELLPGIVKAVGAEVDVMFDSGVRCGADIVKALALGARMVLIGRPYVYGLAFGGEDGVRHVIKALLGEVQTTMHQAGVASVDELIKNGDYVVRDDQL